MRRVVDLGTKYGGALDEFLREGSIYFGKDVHTIPPCDCLGVDRNLEYVRNVGDKGYAFRCADLTEPAELEYLPEADYYLAWDFLEHLLSPAHADAVLQMMLRKARLGVWLRMPSFESDDVTGEGPLRTLGLRFAWTRWKGHPNPYILADVRRVVPDDGFTAKIKSGRLIRSTMDRAVVPVEAPVDTVRYSENLGEKPLVLFDPPLVGQWEVIIKRQDVS